MRTVKITSEVKMYPYPEFTVEGVVDDTTYDLFDIELVEHTATAHDPDYQYVVDEWVKSNFEKIKGDIEQQAIDEMIEAADMERGYQEHQDEINRGTL